MHRFTFLFVTLFYFSVAYGQHPGWTVYTNGDDITALAESGNDMWVGTEGGGLVKIDKTSGGTNFYNNANSGMPDNWVNTIVIDASGNKWIGTFRGGLAKFDGTNWTVYDTTNSGLPFNHVTFITIDESGNKWIGTSGGLAKFDGINWTVYETTNSGLPDNSVNSIAIDANGNKWIGTNRGLAVFSGGSAIKDLKISQTPKTNNIFLHFPAPFRGNASISYSVANKGNVSFAVYSLAGKRIKMLLNETKSAGTYAVSWDGKDETGHPLPAGVYICDFVCGKTRVSEKMNLVR
jgi:ligand-binding sensor domain-containing protein